MAPLADTAIVGIFTLFGAAIGVAGTLVNTYISQGQQDRRIHKELYISNRIDSLTLLYNKLVQMEKLGRQFRDEELTPLLSEEDDNIGKDEAREWVEKIENFHENIMPIVDRYEDLLEEKSIFLTDDEEETLRTPIRWFGTLLSDDAKPYPWEIDKYLREGKELLIESVRNPYSNIEPTRNSLLRYFSSN